MHTRIIFRIIISLTLMVSIICVGMMEIGKTYATTHIMARVYSVIQDRQRMALIDVNRNLPIRIDFPIATSTTAIMRWSSDGERVIVQTGAVNQASFYAWDIFSGRIISLPEAYATCGVDVDINRDPHTFSWLADNQHVVFYCRNNPMVGVYTFDFETAHIYKLYDRIPAHSKMQWSPNSHHVAMVDMSNGRIHLIDVHGTENTIISPQGRRFASVAWMPDGESLLAVGNTTLERYWVNSDEWQVVVNDFETVSQADNAVFIPQISPNGEWVTLISGDRLRRAYNFNLQTGERVILETQQIRLNDVQRVIWSPNSQWLIISTPIRSQDDMYYLIRPDAAVLIAFGEGFGGLPQWSPDGMKISYITSPNAGNTLFIWEVDSFLPANAISSNVEDSAWSTDSRHLIFTYRIVQPIGIQQQLGYYSTAEATIRFLTPLSEQINRYWFLP